MGRILIYVVLITAAGSVAVWVAEQPGEVRLTWQGYLLESSVSMLFVLVIVCAVLLAIAYEVLNFIFNSPRLIHTIRRNRSRERGYRSLTRGMVAVAAGDVKAAKRAVRATEALHVEPPLRLLLTAQAAQLEGDEIAARESFQAMLADPESEFLGLRGLLVQSLRKGDKVTALALARRAFEINPRAEWVLTNLIDLETIAGNWPDAEQSVIAAQRAKRIKPENARRRRALLLYQRAQAAFDQTDEKTARDLAMRAINLRADFMPAVVFAAKLLAKVGHLKRARKLIMHAWQTAPHPDLADTLVQISEPLTPLARIKVLEPLMSLRPGDLEGHLVLASALLDASLWGAAREHLGQASRGMSDQRLYRLMARLEEGENNDEGAARQWLLKASRAPSEPIWKCRVCGEIANNWGIQCSSCEAVDSLEWGTANSGDSVDRRQELAFVKWTKSTLENVIPNRPTPRMNLSQKSE